MPTTYDEVLDATICHLEDLKSRGVQHIAVTGETLRELSQPAKFSVPQAKAKVPTASHEAKKSEDAFVSSPSPPGEGESSADNWKRHKMELGSGVQRANVVTDSRPEIQSSKSSVEKTAAFEALRERVSVCVKCPNLASSRKNTVFGVGNIEAQLMFVGEAPGADEDAQGEPFVGRAGELLTRIIQAMGLQRGDVYIANILKCRPDTPGQSAGNRKPTSDEMATCISYLHEQIDLIQPRVIVALGATAIEGLLGKTIGVTKMRGEWKTYRNTPLMPTYHPAYLLRNQAMSEKRKVWEDMLAVMEKLEMSISDKQRNYFLKA